eukprot:CAMPEP_0171989996 /NCGR_PEP_ID=MMETSP0993-20121228/276696_1 /TAXON_ID=483369 /ORGANISM="non described non described, Strain CCMP2098" /LENGTH=337 /DNA_ID=CAMNT_0012642993 /DNA_START=93 /DNA_END=1102 /DNA_ORIENTATION=+
MLPLSQHGLLRNSIVNCALQHKGLRTSTILAWIFLGSHATQGFMNQAVTTRSRPSEYCRQRKGNAAGPYNNDPLSSRSHRRPLDPRIQAIRTSTVLAWIFLGSHATQGFLNQAAATRSRPSEYCRQRKGNAAGPYNNDPPSSRSHRRPLDPRIQAIKDCGNWERALDLLNDIGPDAKLAAYHAAIGVCSRKRQPVAARLLLTKMKNADVAPTLITYSQVMSGFSKLGRWKAAIGVCSRKRQPEAARLLMTKMRNAGFDPNLIAYCQVMNGFSKLGRWKETLQLLDTLEKQGLKPDKFIFGGVITACEKGGQWEKAVEILNSMADRGVQPDVITFSAA